MSDLDVGRVLRFLYVASFVAFAVFASAFRIMDFTTTVIGIRDCVDCEASPAAREMYLSGGAAALYHAAALDVEVLVSLALFGLAVFVVAEFFALPFRWRAFLYGVSFAVYLYVMFSALYRMWFVYNNLWALYYGVFGVGGG